MGFQTAVNANPAPAVEGDFASANPRNSVLAGPGELTAGPLGLLIGRFAWAADLTGRTTNEHPGAAAAHRFGFVHRDQPAVITGWLEGSTMRVQAGIEITMFNAGDFWARFAAGCTIGQKVFASYADGSAIAGTAGSPPAGASFTGSAGASATAINGVQATAKVGGAVTGSIAANVLTVSAVTASAKIHVGDLISGPGGSSDPIEDGTTILEILTGTGGVGTYAVSVAQTVTSAAVTVESKVATVTAIAADIIRVGDIFNGTGWPTDGTAIASQVSGTAGSTGDYLLDVDAPFAAVSTTITAPSTLLTVSAVASGHLYAGDTLAGTGVATGQSIVSQLTGAAGGIGTYRVSVSDYSASNTVTSDSDVLEVSAVASGTVAPGQPFTGTSVDAGSFLGAQISGTLGGVGNYYIYPRQAIASTALTSVAGYETDFYVASTGAAGDVAKITSTSLN